MCQVVVRDRRRSCRPLEARWRARYEAPSLRTKADLASRGGNDGKRASTPRICKKESAKRGAILALADSFTAAADPQKPQPSRGMQLPLNAMPHRQELGRHPPLCGHPAVPSVGLSCSRSERRPLLLSGVLTWRAHPTSQHRAIVTVECSPSSSQRSSRNPCKSSARLDLAPSFDPCNQKTPCVQWACPRNKGPPHFFFLGSRRDARAIARIHPALDPVFQPSSLLLSLSVLTT
jgi:hypothetical protein